MMNDLFPLLVFRVAGPIVALAFNTASVAQEVYSTSGSFFQNANTQIAFSIGEPIIATHSTVGAIATQGFHQPPVDFSTEVVHVSDPSIHVSVYPNPARELVTVVVEGMTGVLALDLVDASGRVVATRSSSANQQTWDVSQLASGCYTIRAFAQEQFLSTIKLTIAR